MQSIMGLLMQSVMAAASCTQSQRSLTQLLLLLALHYGWVQPPSHA